MKGACDFCRTKTHSNRIRLRKLEDFEYHSRLDIVELFDLAQDGCHVSAIIYDGLSKYAELSAERGKAFVGINIWHRDPQPVKAWIVDSAVPEKGIGTLHMEIYSAPDSPISYAPFSQTPHVMKNSASDLCFELIRKWAGDCLHDHPECASQASTTLPTRVLDVGSEGQEPRLVESHHETGKYICLSHCWGPKPICRTTKTNFDAMKFAIPWASLSKTFQDSITITRKLGLRYLWIDALCIVQDDSIDWETESAKMRSIYQNAYLTIAATSSADGDGGCFSERPVYCSGHHEIVLDGVCPPGTFFVRKALPLHFTDSITDPDLSKHPLHTRAWAFQERLLSPRLVNFATDELTFECRTLNRCECKKLDVERYTKPSKRLYHDSLENGSLDAISAQWAKLVNLYSQRHLTYECDILPAFSGIASTIQNAHTGSYLAGLWSHDLHRGLLWHVSNPQKARRPIDYRAPTWSWASVVDAVVQFPFGGQLPRAPKEISQHVEIVEAQCTGIGIDPTGKVTCGFLKIKGPLTPAMFCAETETQTVNQGHVMKEILWYFLEAAGKRHKFYPDVYFKEQERMDLSKDFIYCLKISTINYGFQPPLPLNLQITDSLVLRRCNSTNEEYQRIGYLSQQEPEIVDGLFQNVTETIITLI